MSSIIGLFLFLSAFADQNVKAQSVFDLLDQFHRAEITSDQLHHGLCTNNAVLTRSSLAAREEWLQKNAVLNNYQFSPYQVYQLEFKSKRAFDTVLNLLSRHQSLNSYFQDYNLYSITLRSASGTLTLVPRRKGFSILHMNHLNPDETSVISHSEKNYMAFGYLIELSLINQTVAERFKSLGIHRVDLIDDNGLKFDLYVVLAAMGYKFLSTASESHYFELSTEADLGGYRHSLFKYTNDSPILNTPYELPDEKSVRAFYNHFEKYAAMLKIVGDKKIRLTQKTVEYYRSPENWRLPAVLEDTLKFVEKTYPGLIEQTVTEGRQRKWNFSDSCISFLNSKPLVENPIRSE